MRDLTPLHEDLFKSLEVVTTGFVAARDEEEEEEEEEEGAAAGFCDQELEDEERC